MYDAESETCCAQTKTIINRNNNYIKNDDDEHSYFTKSIDTNEPKSNCILKVHDYLFKFILNINQIQDHQKTILDIQT